MKRNNLIDYGVLAAMLAILLLAKLVAGCGGYPPQDTEAQPPATANLPDSSYCSYVLESFHYHSTDLGCVTTVFTCPYFLEYYGITDTYEVAQQCVERIEAVTQCEHFGAVFEGCSHLAG